MTKIHEFLGSLSTSLDSIPAKMTASAEMRQSKTKYVAA